MNEDILKGKWTQLKWLFKEAFGELTDDEILELEWNSDKAVWMIQEKYWITKEEAQEKIEKFLEEHGG